MGIAQPAHLGTRGMSPIPALVSSPCPRIPGERGFQGGPGWLQWVLQRPAQGGVYLGTSSLLTPEKQGQKPSGTLASIHLT